MFPFIVLSLFGRTIEIPTYGFMLATGFTLGYFLALRRGMQLGESPKNVENLFVISVFSALAGSRLFHVIFEEPVFYRANPWRIFAIWEGGYTFYGGLIAGIFFFYLYCRLTKISFLQFCDIAGPTTMLGLFIGRLGCFAAGCCWGRQTDSIFGVTFSHPSTFAAIKHIPVHPAQLYESFGGLLIFLYLMWLFPRRNYVGQIMFHGLVGYAILRFIVEIFRGDDYRGYVLNGLLSYSQVISIAILICTVAAMILLRPKAVDSGRA